MQRVRCLLFAVGGAVLQIGAVLESLNWKIEAWLGRRGW